MDRRPKDEHGTFIIPEYDLGGTTVIHDRARNTSVMRLRGVVVLPVGAEIELPFSLDSAVVERVRLLAGSETDPPCVCLDVRVPANYYSATA